MATSFNHFSLKDTSNPNLRVTILNSSPKPNPITFSPLHLPTTTATTTIPKRVIRHVASYQAPESSTPRLRTRARVCVCVCISYPRDSHRRDEAPSPLSDNSLPLGAEDANLPLNFTGALALARARALWNNPIYLPEREKARERERGMREEGKRIVPGDERGRLNGKKENTEKEKQDSWIERVMVVRIFVLSWLNDFGELKGSCVTIWNDDFWWKSR